MEINEDNASSVNQWGAGGADLEMDRNHRHGRGLISRSHSEGYVVFMSPL